MATLVGIYPVLTWREREREREESRGGGGGGGGGSTKLKTNNCQPRTEPDRWYQRDKLVAVTPMGTGTVGELRVEQPQLLAGAGGAVERPLRVPQTIHLYFHRGERRKHLLHALALLLLLLLRQTALLRLIPLHPVLAASAHRLLLLLLEGGAVHRGVGSPPPSVVWQRGHAGSWLSLRRGGEGRREEREERRGEDMTGEEREERRGEKRGGERR